MLRSARLRPTRALDLLLHLDFGHGPFQGNLEPEPLIHGVEQLVGRQPILLCQRVLHHFALWVVRHAKRRIVYRGVGS